MDAVILEEVLNQLAWVSEVEKDLKLLRENETNELAKINLDSLITMKSFEIHRLERLKKMIEDDSCFTSVAGITKRERLIEKPKLVKQGKG